MVEENRVDGEGQAMERFLRRYQELVDKYRAATESRSRTHALGEFVLHHGATGIAIVKPGREPAANQRFYQFTTQSGRWVCLSDPTVLVPGALSRFLYGEARALLALLDRGVADAPRRQTLVFLARSSGAHVEAQIDLFPEPTPRVAILLRDVSERAELKRRREEAQHRDEFLAMLAHELRSPLASIVSAAELLLRGGDPVRARGAAEAILRQAQHQARLVSDLLDAARVRQGKIVLQPVRLDLREPVREAIAATEHERSHGVRLHASLPDRPVWVMADPTRLVQCVTNLLVNAAKFTPAGGENWISLEVDGVAWVRVRDNGQGIDADLLPHLFEPFTQADSSLARRRGGLGLGLALTRKLITMHEGGVRADSEGQGRGAAFTFWLPRAEAPAEVAQPDAEAGAAEPAEHPVRRVLLVEDNVDVSEMLRELLVDEGFEVSTAPDGLAGAKAALDEQPDAVVSDLGLPELDGIGMAERIRRLLPRSVFIALSGYSRREERERAERAGFDIYLVKPINVADLVRMLRSAHAAAAHA